MVSNPEVRLSWLWVVLATAVTAALWWFGGGLTPNPMLVWFAPVPMLWLCARARGRVLFAAALVAWFIGGMNLWPYLREELNLPVVAMIAVTAVPALVFALCMLVVHAHWRRGRLLLGALSYPACWVTVEFLMARASPHGTFGNLAYTQVELLPLLQSVALAGPWALSFVVCALAAGLGGWFVPRVSLVRRAAVCGMTLALLGGAWAYGTWRLSANSATPASLRVALIAADQPPYPLPMDDARAQGAVDAYLAAIEQRGLEGARAVVLPETIVRADATQWPALSQRFADYARRLNLTIVVGIDLIEAEHERNVAAVFMPGGDAPLLHAKRHLVPMFEDRYTPGAATTVFDGLGGMWGAAVCKDLDFTTLGRDYGAASIAVLFVPAWDFGRDGWLHARMAMMRGVEQGYAVARAARRGLLTLSDNRGRVLVEVDSASAAVASALSELPVAAERTPYARIGDAFAWLCVAFALVSGLAMRRTGGAMR